MATKSRPDVPLHVAAAWLRPPAARADDDDDGWGAVIARAKLQAASPKTPAPRTPPLPRHAPAKAPNPPAPRPPRYGWAEMPDTPPPAPPRQRARAPEATHATLDALVSRGLRRLTAPHRGR